MELPISKSEPLFVVGPNGVGKSGLMYTLAKQNPYSTLRIAAHRQTWMESNAVPFSPAQKAENSEVMRSIDAQPNARWMIWNPQIRTGVVISDLIDADNELSRKVRATLATGDTEGAKKMALELPPLSTINEIFAASGMPIELSIAADSSIVASKNGGAPYSIAALSDGERAALLIAGMVLTARPGLFILVDEPERHLHASIVTPLLLQLFAKRPDCAFVVSTHELALPISSPKARTVLVRDSVAQGEVISKWDLDILEPGAQIDDATKLAILGARRKILFIEGDAQSLDKPLYQLLFPGVTIFPRSTSFDVQHAVYSVRDSAAQIWVQAFGIVDKDQLTAEKIAALEAKGVFPLSVYSVEALYYNPRIIEALAKRQASVIDADADQMVAAAKASFIAAVEAKLDHMAARMSEQIVKDQVSLGMLDWKRILNGENVAITVDAQSHLEGERKTLRDWLAAGDMEQIVKRYPIRESQAIQGITAALQFKNRGLYEAAARKLVTEDGEIKAFLLGMMGALPAAIAQDSTKS